MKKDSPYTFEGLKPSPSSNESGGGGSGSTDGSPAKPSGSSGASKRRPRSRSPPRQQQRHGAAADGSVVWQKMVKRSSPVKPRREGGSVLHVSLSWENLFSDADRQSKLRMGVKLLALLAFSPLFLAKACIDLVSSLNQYLLDYLPGIVDATYTWAVLPVSKTCYRIARLISTAINALLVRPALAVARWWWALIVPPVAAALLWLWGGICAVPGWAWAQACAFYLVIRHRLLPSVHRKIKEDVWPWINARVVRPIWEAYVALFRWSYGTLHAHVLLPIQTTVTRLTGYVTGQCRRAGTGVVGAAKGAVQFVRDGFEVAGICFGILVLGRSPAGKED